MAFTKNFNTNLALNLFNDFGSQFATSTSTYSANVAATTDTTLVVPAGSGKGKLNDMHAKFLARFRYAPTATVFVSINGVATPSLTGSFVANSSIINPECKEVKAGDTIHFYSAAAANVTVEFFAI